LAQYISKCLPTIESMVCKIGQIAIGHIGQIEWCFTKVPPCGRARFKTLWKRGHICPICPILFSCPVITHWTDFLQHASHNRWTRYPQTDSASVRRIKVSGFYPAGGLPCVCSIASPRARYAPSSGLPAMRACMYRRGCPVASWGDLERLCGIGEAGLQVDSAMPCCYLGAWCDADRGQPAWIPANHRPIVQAIERQVR
jgi:hypothetical protein